MTDLSFKMMIAKLEKWSGSKQIIFNSKCKTLYLGKNVQLYNYKMSSDWLMIGLHMGDLWLAQADHGWQVNG